MRTNIVLDDDLVREATRLTGIRTKRSLVDEALRLLVKTKKRRSILALKGRIQFADGYDHKTVRARVFFDCRRKGLTVRSSTDCLIAALALERGDVLLHDDADFDAIAKVRPLRSIRG